jgi:hypothetical protein
MTKSKEDRSTTLATIILSVETIVGSNCRELRINRNNIKAPNVLDASTNSPELAMFRL